MRQTLHSKLNAGRVRSGPYGGSDRDVHNGAFRIVGPNGALLLVMASDGSDPVTEGWEHVSVSLPNRCPNWPEMCFIKGLFWSSDECVIQFHPPDSDNISNHAYCLHLWRDTKNGHLMPPPVLVGYKELGDLTNNPAAARRVKPASSA